MTYCAQKIHSPGKSKYIHKSQGRNGCHGKSENVHPVGET